MQLGDQDHMNGARHKMIEMRFQSACQLEDMTPCLDFLGAESLRIQFVVCTTKRTVPVQTHV